MQQRLWLLDNDSVSHIRTENKSFLVKYQKMPIKIYVIYCHFPATDRAFETTMCCARSLVVVSTCLADPVFPENSRALPTTSDQIMHRVNTPRS